MRVRIGVVFESIRPKFSPEGQILVTPILHTIVAEMPNVSPILFLSVQRSQTHSTERVISHRKAINFLVRLHTCPTRSIHCVRNKLLYTARRSDHLLALLIRILVIRTSADTLSLKTPDLGQNG